MSRLEKTLHQIAAAFQAPRSNIVDSLERGLVDALTEGKSIVLELDRLINDEVLKKPDKKGITNVDRVAWIRKKKKVSRN